MTAMATLEESPRPPPLASLAACHRKTPTGKARVKERSALRAMGHCLVRYDRLPDVTIDVVYRRRLGARRPLACSRTSDPLVVATGSFQPPSSVHVGNHDLNGDLAVIRVILGGNPCFCNASEVLL